jgi:hypothetical protein
VSNGLFTITITALGDNGAALLNAVTGDFGIDFDQIFTGHTWFTRGTRCHHNHIRISGVGIVVSTDNFEVVAFDRSSFGQIETFALGYPFDYVQQHHVAEFFGSNPVGSR